MKAEIIAVGTELLLGDIVNTNASWISKQLALLGVDVYHHVTVGDNPGRLSQVIAQAVERANLLIFTGGLGPTDDDLTIATIAHHFQTPLIQDADSEKTIQCFFQERGMPMAASNLKQAQRPETAQALPNPTGTAPGLVWDLSTQTGKPTYILAFPGVPKELYAMWSQAAAFIRQKQQESNEQADILVAQSLHFFGIGESRLGEMLSDLMTTSNPTVAPYVGQADVRIRIAAKADSEATAMALIAPVKAEIIRRCRDYYYADNDTSLEAIVAAELLQRRLTVSVAESCTGGLLSSRLTDVPGSSGYTLGNIVTYSNDEKIAQLGVLPSTLEAVGAVSPEVAMEMAHGVHRRGRYDISVAITGIAGPAAPQEANTTAVQHETSQAAPSAKPVGLAYIAIAWNTASLGEQTHTHKPDNMESKAPSEGAHPSSTVIIKKIQVNSRYERKDIKYWFSQYALFFLLQALRGTLQSDYSEQSLYAMV